MVVVASYHVPAEFERGHLVSQAYLSLHGYHYCSAQFHCYDVQPCKLADCSELIYVIFPHKLKPIAQNTLSAVTNW